MKRLILTLAAGLVLLSLAACSADDAAEPAYSGTVTFNLQLPKEIASRAEEAAGKGTQISTLHYAVYYHDDTSGKPVFVDPGCPDVSFAKGKAASYANGQFSLTLELADAYYDIVFYATSDSPAYVYNYETKEIGLGSNLSANQEGYDAFYGKLENYSPTYSTTVNLTRPFAQLNVGYPSASQQPTLTQSKIVIKDVPTNLNLLTGNLGTGTADAVFDTAPLPSFSFPVDGYSYVGMAYVLAAAPSPSSQSAIYTVEFTPSDGTTKTWTNIPLRTNYRTNILCNPSSSSNFILNIVTDWKDKDMNVEENPELG